MSRLMFNGKCYSGGKFLIYPECYSTEEREIGCWTDGKPLYEKTLYVASGQLNQTTFIDMPTQSGIERLVSYKGSVYDVNDQRYYALPYERLGATEGIWVMCHVLSDHTLTPMLFTRQSFTYSLSNIFVTIQYTKVADTAGSGTWTPQGVPAVHYSTGEHIIGTWVDGSTLYGRTIAFDDLDLISETNGAYISVTIPNINKLHGISVLLNESIPVTYYQNSSLYITGFSGISSNTFEYHFRYGSTVESDRSAYFNNSTIALQYTKSSN